MIQVTGRWDGGIIPSTNPIVAACEVHQSLAWQVARIFASLCVQHLYSFFDPLAGAAKKYRESLSLEQVDKLELRFLKHVMQVSSTS
jgi:hypothetical protein